jgi:hypothetical protein
MEEAHHQHTVDYHKGSGSRVESFRTSRYNLEYRKWGAHRLLGTLLLVQHRGWEQCPCTCAHSHWNSTSGLSCNQYRCCIPQSIFLQHHFPLRDRSDRERWNQGCCSQSLYSQLHHPHNRNTCCSHQGTSLLDSTLVLYRNSCCTVVVGIVSCFHQQVLQCQDEHTNSSQLTHGTVLEQSCHLHYTVEYILQV